MLQRDARQGSREAPRRTADAAAAKASHTACPRHFMLWRVRNTGAEEKIFTLAYFLSSCACTVAWCLYARTKPFIWRGLDRAMPIQVNLPHTVSCPMAWCGAGGGEAAAGGRGRESAHRRAKNQCQPAGARLMKAASEIARTFQHVLDLSLLHSTPPQCLLDKASHLRQLLQQTGWLHSTSVQHHVSSCRPVVSRRLQLTAYTRVA